MAIPTVGTAGAGAGGTIATEIPLPASYAADDFLLLVLETNGSNAEPDPDNPLAPAGLDTSGWTLIGSNVSQAVGFADQTRLTAYYKRAVASETAPTASAPGAANHVLGFIVPITGFDWVNGINDTEWGQSSTNDTSVSNIPAVTSTLADCLIVNVSSAGDDSIFSLPVNANLTSVTINKQYENSNGTAGCVGVITGGLAIAGSSGATTATISTTEEEANLTLALPGLAASYQFAPPTYTQPLNDEEVNHPKRWSLWRHYSGVIPTPYIAIITGGVSNTAPGVVSPTTWDEKGNPEVPNAEYSQTGADDGSGDAGKAVFTGGSTYTITTTEREALNTGGYGSYIT